MIVDNFDLLTSKMDFSDPDQSYYLQLLLRKKDGTTTFGNKNNSARIVQSYDIYNLDYLEKKKREIIGLCDMYGCRAMVNMNRRVDRLVAFGALKHLVDQILTGNYRIGGLLNTIRGGGEVLDKDGNVKKGYSVSYDKLWLVDCDSSEETEFALNTIPSLRGVDGVIQFEVPTVKGTHLITKAFDTQEFNTQCQIQGLDISIHKNNPTLLYFNTERDE